MSTQKLRVVCSLTSMPNQYEKVIKTLESLHAQTHKLDAIYLSLPEISRRLGTKYPPVPKEISNNRIEFTDIRKNKSNLNLIRIKENGDFDYQEILDDKQNQVPFMVSKGIIIDSSIYFLGRKGREKQLLKITL